MVIKHKMSRKINTNKLVGGSSRMVNNILSNKIALNSKFASNKAALLNSRTNSFGLNNNSYQRIIKSTKKKEAEIKKLSKKHTSSLEKLLLVKNAILKFKEEERKYKQLEDEYYKNIKQIINELKSAQRNSIKRKSNEMNNHSN